MVKLLHILGSSDNNRLLVMKNDGNASKLQVRVDGCNTSGTLANSDQVEVKTITMGGISPQEIDLPETDIILNAICDPDTNLLSLQQTQKLIEHFEGYVVNHPASILRTTRNAIYDQLHKIDKKLIVPRTICITPNYLSDIHAMINNKEIAYPFIFRGSGSHGGLDMLLITGEEELVKLECFAFDGRSFYVSDFVDYRSKDGLYRKSRIMVIGGEAYLRHLIISDNWKVHGNSREKLMLDSEALRDEEKEFIAQPHEQIQALCHQIYNTLNLDYFGIDCHVGADGSMLIFEINACMHFTYDTSQTNYPKSYLKFAYLLPNATAIKTAMDQMLVRLARPD